MGWKDKVRTHIKSVSIAAIGCLSAIAVPVWQIYFVETSNITIEISGIRRVSSNHYRVSLATEELKLLEPYIDEDLLYEIKPDGSRGDRIRYPAFDVKTLLKAYKNAKIDLKRIAETKRQISRYITTINAYLDPTNHKFQLTEFRVAEMKRWGLSNYIDDDEAAYYEQQVLSITRNYSNMPFKSKVGKEPPINGAALKFLLSDVKEDLLQVITSNDAMLETLRENLSGIDEQLSKINKQQRELYSFFELDVMVTNNGRASESLLPLSMIRVNINGNNYVDVKLKLLNSQELSELPPSSTRVLRYRSNELYQMPVEDRNLVNSFWGSAGEARLLCLDTKGRVYVSEPKTFADNSNQKILFDYLRKAASTQHNEFIHKYPFH